MKTKKQINRAASNFLCDQESGSLYDAYKKLIKASDKGKGNEFAYNFVTQYRSLLIQYFK